MPHRLLVAGLLTLFTLAPAWAQREGRSDRYTEFLKRLDTSGDGILTADEIPGRAERFVARLAEQAGLPEVPPYAVSKLTGQLTGDRDEDRRDRRRERSPSEAEPAVPGFGEPSDLSAPPGFGPPDELASVVVEERYEDWVIRRADEVLARYDRNKTGVLEETEWAGARWRPDPQESDLNGDQRLTRAELCERYAKREGRGWKKQEERSASTSSSTKSFGGSSNDPSRDDDSESLSVSTRDYVSGLIKRYDEDKDGVIDGDEFDKAERWQSADTNKDRRITSTELAARLKSWNSEKSDSTSGASKSSSSRSASRRSGWGWGRSRGSDSGDRDEDDDAPTIRSRTPHERLPRGLPDWFREVDSDRDGQVKMAEFASRWSDAKVAEFLKYDLNGDGLITPLEALRAEDD